jgi:hypothetical protein
METTHSNSQMSFGNGHDKYTNKVEQLKTYVSQIPYIDPIDQPKVCASFGLPHIVSIFRNEYRSRFYAYLLEHTTTAASITIATGIHQKYLCQCKDYYEKRNLLKVVGYGTCPSTRSQNVQFLSTNKEKWNEPGPYANSNQLSLF